MRMIVKHMRPREGERIAHVEFYLEEGDPQYEKFLVDELDADGNPTGKKVSACVYGKDVRIPDTMSLAETERRIQLLYEDIKRQMGAIDEAERSGLIGREYRED